MAYFEGARSQISDAKNPQTAISVLIKSILLRMDEALSGENTEHQLRVLRDKLEAEKDGLVSAIAAKTGEARGPNDPDDAEENPQEFDPLKRNTSEDPNTEDEDLAADEATPEEGGHGESAPRRSK